jgi:TetR/AcrR family transcriptional regulator
VNVAKSAVNVSTGDVRTRIIEAALEEFAVLGFEGARMPAIAKRAGVGHPLVHYHFGGKEALWKAAVEHAFRPLVEAYATGLDDLRDVPPIQALQIMMRRFILFSGRHPHVGMLVSRESMIGGPRLRWLAKTVIAPLHRTMGTVLRAAVASGEIKDLPEANLIQALIGAVVQFFNTGPLLRELYKIDPLQPKRIEEHADLLMDVLLNGLRRP